MAVAQGCRRRLVQLHAYRRKDCGAVGAGDSRPQRLSVPLQGLEQRGDDVFQSSDADGNDETQDHSAADEYDSRCGQHGRFFGHGLRRRAELSVAVPHEQRRQLDQHHEQLLQRYEDRNADSAGDGRQERLSVPLQGVKQRGDDVFQRSDADGKYHKADDNRTT